MVSETNDQTSTIFNLDVTSLINALFYIMDTENFLFYRNTTKLIWFTVLGLIHCMSQLKISLPRSSEIPSKVSGWLSKRPEAPV